MRRGGTAICSCATASTHGNIGRSRRHQCGAIEHATGATTTACGIVCKARAATTTATDNQVLHRHCKRHGHCAVEHNVIRKLDTGRKRKRRRRTAVVAHGQGARKSCSGIRAKGQCSSQHIDTTTKAVGAGQINYTGALLNQFARTGNGGIDRKAAGTIRDQAAARCNRYIARAQQTGCATTANLQCAFGNRGRATVNIVAGQNGGACSHLFKRTRTI